MLWIFLFEISFCQIAKFGLIANIDFAKTPELSDYIVGLRVERSGHLEILRDDQKMHDEGRCVDTDENC